MDGDKKDKSKAIGGRARADKLSAEQRKEIATLGAKARWEKLKHSLEDGIKQTFAEEPAETAPILETREVIVSATKTEIPVKQVTSAVEVITGEQMQQRKLKTVAEALRWAQGLTVNQSGGPGTNVDVRMRGGTPEQTLVMIDGAIMNSATIGSYDFANLTTDNIERIEILMGNQIIRFVKVRQ